MEAKDKAKELVTKFKDDVYNAISDMTLPAAKKCAIICVDDIQKEISQYDNTAYDGYGYWEQVKNEINQIKQLQ